MSATEDEVVDAEVDAQDGEPTRMRQKRDWKYEQSMYSEDIPLLHDKLHTYLRDMADEGGLLTNPSKANGGLDHLQEIQQKFH